MTDNLLPLILIRIEPHDYGQIDEKLLEGGVVTIDERAKLLAVRATLNAIMGSLNAIPGKMNLEYKQRDSKVIVNFYLEDYATEADLGKLFMYVASHINAARIQSCAQTHPFSD